MSETNNQSNEGQNDNAEPQLSVKDKLIGHVRNNRIECALWATRVLTIVFAIGYIIPIFG